MKGFDKKKLKEKEALIDNATEILKKEFVGIDEQIDGIMDNLRTWFLFPELQIRPLVVCLWGMTGVGKTSLVNRIAQLLDIEQDKVYFNFAEIGECSSWEIEDRIENELSNERSNRMFVYDEFQYAATLDRDGTEKDKKSGLKPFWELLDTGRLHKRHDFWNLRQLYLIASYMVRINEYCPMVIENGVWVNAKECLTGFNAYEVRKFRNFFNWDDANEKKAQDDETGEDIQCNPRYEVTALGRDNSPSFFIKEHFVEAMLGYFDNNNSTITDHLEGYKKLLEKDYDEILDLIEDIYKNSSKGYDLNFSDSIIFVLGNLDEAYEVALNVDPDMSPDQFHKITKKISIVDIKKALQERFRNEQIARLGNIHLIYPSFSSDSFKKIISMALEGYAMDVRNKVGLNMVFKKSLYDIIYKESVFPTHGTRPIFSTIHEIVKTKLPLIMREIFDNGLNDVSAVEFSFSKRNTIIKFINGEGSVAHSKKFREKLRLENLRSTTKDEEQSLTAVHESGHFVVYASLYGKMPEKLCSKTTSKDTGGFLLKDYDDNKGKPNSYEEIINTIKVSLGGYVAEKMVFGEKKRTSGAYEDLRKATAAASKMVRAFGMAGDVVFSTYYTEANNCMLGHAVKDDDNSITNGKIRDIVNKCLAEVETILSNPEWKKMLRESAIYLSNNSTMPKKKMLECYMMVDENVRKLDDDSTYYRQKLQEI